MNISPEALEAICRSGLEYMLMVSIISSDNIITIKDAEEAIDTINSLEKAVKASALDSKKKEWFNEKIKQGREILDGDIERFKKN